MTLGAIYAAAVGVRNSFYDGGTFRTSRLQRPVISIGNISVGGTGKTPFAIMLGELLKTRGIEFDVLSRGYRRLTSGVRVVDPQGHAEDFGDEPLLIARALQVPVVVGEGRYEAGRVAEEKFAGQLHLLDDGFQHRQLARDFDIVLVAAEDIRERMLPLGRLREPLSSLARAQVVVVEEGVDVAPLRLRSAQAVWRVKRGIKISGAAARPVAFCGIAKPENFFGQLHASGVGPVAEIAFRDHHRYGAADVRRLRRLAQDKNANGFVTTAKDAVNLGAFARDLQPLVVAEVAMELMDGGKAVDMMLKKVFGEPAGAEKR